MAQKSVVRIFGPARLTFLVVLLASLILCVLVSWATRGAMERLSFQRQNKGATQKGLVDTTPWDTIRALAPLAITAEERDYARQAERLADHDVDQAFAAALRLATLKARQQNLTGEALALSKRVAQLQKLVQEDQSKVDSLSAAQTNPPTENGELDVAKTQLALDTDELTDAKADFAHASGDESMQIKEELSRREQMMEAYDKELKGGGDLAVTSVRKNGTLASRIAAWLDQRSRDSLIAQAIEQTEKDLGVLDTAFKALQAEVRNLTAASFQGSLAQMTDLQTRRQILGIYRDRMATKKQLIRVYNRWSSQLDLQHTIVLHLIMQSLAVIFLILITMLLGAALVRSFMSRLASDRRPTHALSPILRLTVHMAGILLVLFVTFGLPEQPSTIVGLMAAALTFALQDVILAFLGWFVIMGKNGIRVGDWVEINGVSGEVADIGVMSTVLLETGKEKGHPTGRRTSFMNSFAIRGQFFNFTTSGQWMWDEVALTIPTQDASKTLERINEVVEQETKENAAVAEEEWKLSTRGKILSRFSATPVVTFRPKAGAMEVQIRFVTHASERFDTRNRIYRKLAELLRT